MNNKAIRNNLSASVVVSCYNQEQYIEACLTSILEQDVNFSVEIIVCDDASTDSTPQIIKKIASEHPSKFNLQLSLNNVGAAKNYLNGHSLAKGKIVFHFDGDDIMLPGKLQHQFDCFNDESINLVFHRARYFSDDGKVSMDTGSLTSANEPYYFTLNDLACWGTVAVHSSYAYRRSSRTCLDINRDFMEWLTAMDSLFIDGRGVYLDKVLVEYRYNENGSAYSRSRKGRIKAYEIYIQDIFYYFNKARARKELYANALISFLGMVRFNRYFNKDLIIFLLCKCRYFKPGLVLKSLRTRKNISYR